MRSFLSAGNSALRFLLELVSLAVLAVWGWHAGTHTLARLVLATGGPVLAAAGWAQFVAPRAPRFLGSWGRLLVEAVVFGSTAAALVGLERPGLACGFAAVATLNTLLVHVWGQDRRARARATERLGPVDPN